jgi:hypothetical protein
MATLNHEVWANTTTPLFLQAGQSAVNIAPLTLRSTPVPSVAQTTITATSSNGGIYYTPVGQGENQAFGELLFSGTGWALKNNGVTQLAGTTGVVSSSVPIIVADERGNDAVEITTTSVGSVSNPAANIVFEPSSINLGKNVRVQDSVGVVVQDTGLSSSAALLPNQLSLNTITQSPSTATQDFSGATLPPAGYTTTTTAYGGYILSSDNPAAFTFGGMTYTNPSLSPKAVTFVNQPTSGKSIWVYGGYQPDVSVGTYNSYLEFPAITAPAGTAVSVSWRQVGVYTTLWLYKNDTFVSSLAAYTSSGSWVSIPTYTFNSSGNDRLYLLVNNTGRPDRPLNTSYGFGDVSITTNVETYTPVGQVITNGSSLRLSNAAGAYLDVATGGFNFGGGNLTISNNSVNQIKDLNFNQNAAGITFTQSPDTMNINGGSNGALNILNGTASIQFSGNALYFYGTSITFNNDAYFNSASLTMNGNNISNVGSIYANAADAVGAGTLTIGAGSTSNSVFLRNIGILAGTTTASGGTGFTITNATSLNQSPACPPATLWYNANFAGFKLLSTHIIPANNIRMNQAFPTGLVNPNFNGSTYITMPAFTYILLTGGASFSFSNNTYAPVVVSCSVFDPNDASIRYTLAPILV